MLQKTTLYQNAQVSLDVKVLLYGVKKGAILKNWITKLETKFVESAKKINSSENMLQ